MFTFETIDLGTIRWQEALQIQLAYAPRTLHGERFLLLAEHPPVLTLGRNADARNVKINATTAAQHSIELHHSERGGDVTVHSPGQILLYPIMQLSNPFGVRAYIEVLERTVCTVLQRHGITAQVRRGLPGVWVGMAKIAFIGIRIKNRVTQHGLALNVNNDLDLFKLIVPCGLPNIAVTSMSQLLQRQLPLATIKNDLCACFTATLASTSTPMLK